MTSVPTEYRLLGPLEVVHGGEAVPARGQKKRALLARLLLDANRTVSVDALVDALWGEAVPPTAVKMVHIYVSQLRKELPDGSLHTRPPGYVLQTGSEAVDLLRFSRLCAEARAAFGDGDAALAAERLRGALSLWRGPALAEFSEPFAAAEAAHLEELRLLALEDRIDADLALGRHADVVGELQLLVAAHSLRERPRRALMLALYRAGRHAEALATYHDLRCALLDELGIEPSAALRELQVRILNQDPELDLPVAEAASAPLAGAERIVGRAAELDRLEQALAAACDGRGTTALVAGPAGIGKTRVVAELARRARARGATVLTGRCIDVVGVGLPYVPLIEALRPLRGSSVLDGLPELGRLLPGAGAPPDHADGNPGEAQLRLFSSVVTVLDRLAADGPVVLVLEDLQWADWSTLDLMAFLAGAIQGGRILLLATWRHEAVTPDEGLHRLVAGLRRGAATTVELGPLTRDELGRLLARAAGGPVPAELVDAVCARAEGNPFFAQELLAAALRGETSMPVLVRDVLLAEFGRLGREARAVVRVAAAAGRPVTRELLAAAMGIAAGTIAGALREAVEHGVLVPDGALGTYGFRHALIAEAAYDTLLPGELEEVHERLALALAREPSGGAGECAEHWIVARRPAEALVASLEAARNAQAVSGLSEALRHLECVLELWEYVPGAERLTGVAMPALLAWVSELAERPAPARLAVAEARELFPLAVVLESLAIRQSPPFGRAALDALRWANERLRRAAADPYAASAADDDFHAALIAACGDEPLRSALRPIKRALLRYEHYYMADPERIARSAEQHDGIIAALERGDHAEAAQRLRDNLAGGLGILTPALER